MFFDRFDILEAWYLYLSHSHDGQGSGAYARLCKLGKVFLPRPNLSVHTLSENGREIYNQLVA